MTSIASFRARVQQVLDEQQPRRNVIVLAVDGIPYDLACRAWKRARVTRARSVFPSTSATAWTTSLTGLTVEQHGIPGVVFEVGGELIDVYSFKGALGDPPANVFGDASARGYAPVAVLGDLEDTVCTWRDQLVHGAQLITGHRFYWSNARTARALGDRLVAAVEHALSGVGPRFVWCFIDTDRHIHHHGYDAAVIELLERIDALAVEWSRTATVIAHSDHGLVATRHDLAIATTIETVLATHACRMGGAGRARWIYVEPSAEQRVRDELARSLPSSVRIVHADQLFAPGSLARSRVGSIVLIAEGESFLAQDGYSYEHGSLTEGELDTAFAEWPC